MRAQSIIKFVPYRVSISGGSISTHLGSLKIREGEREIL